MLPNFREALPDDSCVDLPPAAGSNISHSNGNTALKNSGESKDLITYK